MRSQERGHTKEKKPAWWPWVDASIQKYIGTSNEVKYFAVMHPIGKVLWSSPTQYENVMNVKLPMCVHNSHQMRTVGLC